MRAGQNHPGKERARNLSQTAVNLRRGHAALADKDTNGSTGSRPSGGFQVMLPAMRREPAGRGYLVSHSFAQNRNRACSHPLLTFLQLSEGGKCLAITHYIGLLISPEEQSLELSWHGKGKHHPEWEEHGKRGCEGVGKTQLIQTPTAREVLTCFPRPSQCGWHPVLARE